MKSRWPSDLCSPGRPQQASRQYLESTHSAWLAVEYSAGAKEKKIALSWENKIRKRRLCFVVSVRDSGFVCLFSWDLGSVWSSYESSCTHVEYQDLGGLRVHASDATDIMTFTQSIWARPRLTRASRALLTAVLQQRGTLDRQKTFSLTSRHMHVWRTRRCSRALAKPGYSTAVGCSFCTTTATVGSELFLYP